MKVRLPTVEIHRENLDEQSQLAMRALGKTPEFIEDESSVVIETDDVSSWFGEKDTTIVNMKNGMEHQVEIDEQAFSVLWVELTCQVIRSVDYRRNPIEEDDDNGDI